MSKVSNETHLRRDLKNILAERRCFSNEETIFCTGNNLEQSSRILFEEFESFGISPVTVHNDPQTSESLRKLSVAVINATWNLIHKYRSLMQQHDQLIDANHKTINDNINLKNHVKRLKEDVQKREHTLCEAQERERRFKVQYENASRELKHEKEEVRKLKKQAQSKDVQHEHEMKRVIQRDDKLQEQLRKSVGTFVPRDKALQKMQADHEEKLALYKRTICRLEENNRQMLEEINNLKEALALHINAIDLHMEASGGWTDVNT